MFGGSQPASTKDVIDACGVGLKLYKRKQIGSDTRLAFKLWKLFKQTKKLESLFFSHLKISKFADLG